MGVCVPDYWMQDMIDGDMDKRKVWAKVLESRQKKDFHIFSLPIMSTVINLKYTKILER